ncbi:universal stress protein [Saccharothrix longispora]|uniref:universal stress protein n=1 Tax=Saccharothrix longispora TaxID=33920 RepID=UPI0028FD6F93|nr:universal stress protein [Saccharothrix longispora]MDU0287612.1 universal stress protein [Saccharothrix longispora]
MSDPIVVGVDGSASASAATGWAASEAVRHGVPLRLVHAYLPPARGYPGVVLTGHEVRTAFEQQARLRLDEAAAVARAAAPGVRVETSVVVDTPAAALVAASQHARQVVLGSRGLGGFTGLLIGSVAVSVAAHGTSPVVVVRDESPADGPVVVGVDGSPTSEEAIAFAFEEASLRGAPLTALIAWTDALVDGARLTVDWSQVEQEESRVLAERLAGWQEKYPDTPVDRVVVHDRPARALLDAARTAQLVVVGSRGLGGFAGMLLGSTSQALVHHAPCPLAVVRAVGGHGR